MRGETDRTSHNTSGPGESKREMHRTNESLAQTHIPTHKQTITVPTHNNIYYRYF
jgi:hypothetical protein